MKKFSAILLSLAMAASLAACGSAPSGTTPGSSGGSGGDVKPVTLKFSGSNNEEHPVTQHMYKIKEAVEKETDGPGTHRCVPRQLPGRRRGGDPGRDGRLRGHDVYVYLRYL